MNDDDQRDPMARLRAADPAAGVEARAGFADEVVARVTGESPAVDGAPVADLSAERSRRRPGWMQVAAVAAALVVVGAVGYGAGATAVGGSNLAGGAAPPISLQGPSDAATAEGGAAPESAAGEEMVREPGTTDMTSPSWGTGRNSFTASGLSTSEGTAAAYAFDARAASTVDTVAALAAALGLDGTPELVDGAWAVGPRDGTGPALGVSLDGTLGFWYSDPGVSPWQCTDGAEVCEPTAGAVPSEQAAVDALRSLLESTGRDATAYEFSSETYEGALTRSAQAWPVVDGQRVDQAWSVELSDRGMVGASGTLAELVPLGDAPIVSEQEAFERLSDPRFSAAITALPAEMRDMPATDLPAWVPPTEPPAAPQPGDPVSWPVNDVEIVDARLGLASQWQSDGGVVVVPAYEFTDADGGTWSVIAVAESELDFSLR
ncbi:MULTISPECIES: hypothetical protein [unclassified Agromyces]|uniref:hypothetical protein n=1 Tax=unclassified Agromyces TaxID=2639701 RepID=UPI003014484E